MTPIHQEGTKYLQCPAECIEALTELNVKMDQLLGTDGALGRLDKIDHRLDIHEGRLNHHDRLVWVCTGGGFVIGFAHAVFREV